MGPPRRSSASEGGESRVVYAGARPVGELTRSAGHGPADALKRPLRSLTVSPPPPRRLPATGNVASTTNPRGRRAPVTHVVGALPRAHGRLFGSRPRSARRKSHLPQLLCRVDPPTMTTESAITFRYEVRVLPGPAAKGVRKAQASASCVRACRSVAHGQISQRDRVRQHARPDAIA